MTNTWAEAADYEIRTLHDAGISAYAGRNRTIGQFGQFLSALRSGELGAGPVLLVENLDRISREELEAAQGLFLEIVGRGATIITLHNGKRYAKGMGLVDIITALVEMDVAHQHSAKLSMRVKAAWDARKRSGAIIHNRSQAPNWLRLNAERTHFEPIPERVELVRRMFDLAALGMGPQAIAGVLNRERMPSWSDRESEINAWRGTMIAKVIYRRSVLGEFDGRAGYFGPAIVDPMLWAKVNSRQRREAQGRGKGIITEGNLLRGLVVSGLDGSKMILQKSGIRSRKTKKYIWHSYLVSNETISGRGSHWSKYELLEARLLWLLSVVDMPFRERSQSEASREPQVRLKEILRKLEDVAFHISECRGLYETGSLSCAGMAGGYACREIVRKILPGATEIAAMAEAKAEVCVRTSSQLLDLGSPDNRRAIRASIAQWCRHIELWENEFVIWFSETCGLRVNLHGDPVVRLHEVAAGGAPARLAQAEPGEV